MSPPRLAAPSNERRPAATWRPPRSRDAPEDPARAATTAIGDTHACRACPEGSRRASRASLPAERPARTRVGDDRLQAPHLGAQYALPEGRQREVSPPFVVI